MSRLPVDRPAPGRLETVRAFVNTLDLDRDSDLLVDLDAAIGWLVGAGLLADGAPSEPGELGDVLRTREAFRGVLVANAEGGSDRDSVTVLNQIVTDAGLTMRLADPATTVISVAATGIIGAMGELASITFEAIADDAWARLKACPANGCHWAFYDASRNRSSRWCDMAVCGNRAKHVTLRRRTRANAP